MKEISLELYAKSRLALPNCVENLLKKDNPTFALTSLFLLLASFGSGTALTGTLSDDAERRIAANRQIVKEVFTTLKGELEKALDAGGPASAIPVCKEKVPEIGKTFKEKYPGWSIRRTTLNTRNPVNAPDEWERKALERFEARKAAGEDPKMMEYSEFVARDGAKDSAKVFRYMKAIPTQEVCTLCHGSSLMPDVVAKLEALYPEDTARGFELGDIRGAFSITQPE
uniref:Tll0287-like domain-containing protein n=1 Tax=Candidatus Kentrum eta TaxID=2126337 RepID=A0A450UXC3_9GAMM|nr:MAG: Protein of unknown function (DUF3365) [Candidatus Kentron sp. H]VFJ97540.1 MAG: Protein of unknown function (DUF3365) [Candidatus Kentron sp. H]VFK03209.1 MAG: Protein of unknown function (DUF3365) [Candidatus Kentron sp. H]